MLYDCPECGDAYAAEEGTVTLCPNCDAENMATFEKPLGAPKSRRAGAWAAGIGAALFILAMAAVSWASLDLDGDGISTYRETQEGSDPFHGDSDRDGLLDGWEMKHGFDSLSMDSDGDGRSDWTEVHEAAAAGETVCDAVGLLLDTCEEGNAEPVQAPPPQEAKSTGATGSVVFGGVSTVVAGVVARLVSAAILRK